VQLILCFTDGITNCEFVDSNGCFIYFTYFYDKDNELKVEVQKDPGNSCSPNMKVKVDKGCDLK
jgi:hypothetical protein